MKISILGAGNMGTALGNMLAKKGHTVSLWTVEKEVYESITKKRENTKYLPGITLDVNITMNLEESISEAEIVVLAVPSNIVRTVAKQASQFVNSEQIIMNVAKGLESDQRLSEVLREELPGSSVIAIGGPSIANDLAKEIPTAVIFASKNDVALKKARAAFSTGHYKICLDNDVAGVELCSAFKNVIALLAGMCDGLKFGPNTKSALITLGLAEISELAIALGAEQATMAGLAGLGDLIVTCTSPDGRNRILGEKIGKGSSLSQASAQIIQVTEGVEAAKVALKLAKKHSLKLLLIETVNKILFENESPKDAILRIFSAGDSIPQ